MKTSILKNNQKYKVEGLNLLVLFSGSLTLKRGLTIKKGSFILCHEDFEISTASPYLEGYVFTFSSSEDEKLYGMLSQLITIGNFFQPLRVPTESSFKEMAYSLSDKKTDEVLAYSYAHILLSKVKDQINVSESQPVSLFEKFKQSIYDNIQHNYCAGEYAELLQIPVTTLIQEVKNEVGKTPCKVITEQVIDYAQKRLLHTNDSSKMIAYQLGFDDPYYFIKYFKKNVGMTPTQFRKQQLVETD